MPLYHLPAKGTRAVEGVSPDFGALEVNNWGGIYDEDTNSYVIRTDAPVEGLTELEPGTDIGFDYSAMVPAADSA